MNILVDATPDATMKIIMDPIAGDYISAKGTGNIRTEFYNKGDVKMFGNYRISQGIYKVQFAGSDSQGFFHQRWKYNYFQWCAFGCEYGYSGIIYGKFGFTERLDSGCFLHCPADQCAGKLYHESEWDLVRPTIKLGIELPNERDEIQTLVRNYISTEEQMNMQILYLLGIGKFYTEDARRNNQNSNVMSSVLSLLLCPVS